MSGDEELRDEHPEKVMMMEMRYKESSLCIILLVNTLTFKANLTIFFPTKLQKTVIIHKFLHILEIEELEFYGNYL